MITNRLVADKLGELLSGLHLLVSLGLVLFLFFAYSPSANSPTILFLLKLIGGGSLKHFSYYLVFSLIVACVYILTIGPIATLITINKNIINLTKEFALQTATYSPYELSKLQLHEEIIFCFSPFGRIDENITYRAGFEINKTAEIAGFIAHRKSIENDWIFSKGFLRLSFNERRGSAGIIFTNVDEKTNNNRVVSEIYCSSQLYKQIEKYSLANEKGFWGVDFIMSGYPKTENGVIEISLVQIKNNLYFESLLLNSANKENPYNENILKDYQAIKYPNFTV